MLLEYLLELHDEYKTAEYFGAYDLSDKFTVFMMIFLLVGSAATSYKFFVNSPLVCFTAVNPTGENFNDFATNYIWTHGSIPSSLLNGTVIDDVSQWNNMLNTSGIHYYQWVPLILLLQCLLLFLCRYLWQSACSSNASHNFDNFLSQCHKISSTAPNQHIKQLALNFNSLINKSHVKNNSCFHNATVWFQTKLSCLGFSRHLGNWMSSRYILFKTATIAMCLIQVLTITSIFDIRLSDLSQIFSTINDPNNTKFPRSVVGFVPNVAVLGSYNSYSISCIMSVNIINEKLFTLLQPLFVMLALCNVISLMSWLINIGIRQCRLNFINKYLSTSIKQKHSSRIDNFIDQYLRWDGLFVLRMMKKSCDNHLVNRLVNELWSQFNDSNKLYTDGDDKSENHLLSCDEIYAFLRKKMKNSHIIIIDPFGSTEILDECGDLISLGYNQRDYQMTDLIIAPVNIRNQFWVLYVYNIQSNTSYMLDPSQQAFQANHVHEAGMKLTEEINKFRDEGVVNYCNIDNNTDRVRQNSRADCGVIVCGYAINLSRQLPLSTPIDIDQMRKQIKINTADQ